MDKAAQDYTVSIPFDKRLYQHDIAGSIAHARMLEKQGIISGKEAESIVMGLISIREEIEQEKFRFKPELEDIHMNVESRLFEKIGGVAGKLHTARSRNDQIALDMRLFAKEAISETTRWILRFQQALLDLAENNKGIIMPGYTHLQHAQPVLLTHHLLAYFEMTDRDKERFRDCLKHTDVLPLGSGALAGVPYPVDRESLARELGFSKVSNNSIDAVSDRDFVVEYEMAAAITMMHLSRLAEELVLWSSAEFGFIKINSVYTTGSSIMPQKKNPDVAELARGKTGRIYGHLVGILTAMKALPLSYNRDMQEDKEGLFDTADTLVSTLEVLTGMVKTLEINARRLEVVTREDFILATDIADYLTKKGVPFRESHKITRELVGYSMDEGKSFHQLTLGEYQKFSPLFQEDVFSITADSSVAARDVPGGTAPRRVEEQLARARRSLEGAG